MPEMSGLKAIEEIRKIDTEGNANIIAVTASAFDNDKSLLIEAGVDAYVSKPINFDTLLKTIASLYNTSLLYEE